MTLEGSHRCEVAGETLLLLAQKAAYWPAVETLLVADIHLGKSAAFRAVGLGVPEGIADDLDRLGALLDDTGARRLVVLGDMFHAPEGQSATIRNSLATWRADRAEIEMIVTRGNHDRGCSELLSRAGFEFVPSYQLGPFCFEHEVDPTADTTEGYCLGGHLHPAIRIPDKTRSFRLPCFWFGQRAGVLPAFGGFTGTHAIDRIPGDRVFAVAEDQVYEL